METKDWILLILPILCNGGFVFLFQLAISRKLKALELRQATVLDTMKKLSGLACEQYDMMQQLIRTCSPGHNPVSRMEPAPFAVLWNPIAERATEIFDYYTIHNTIFDYSGIKINDYAAAYEKVASMLGRKIDVVLTNEDRQEIFAGLSEFRESIAKLNTELEQVMVSGKVIFTNS